LKPTSLRPLAERDLVERTTYYRGEGGPDLGRRFFDAATAALRHAEGAPGIGSPLVGELIGLPGLRRIGIEGFPCGWLYMERADDLDIIRLLADRQDLAGALDVPDPS
jgi:toxin ParE1/3/4